MAARRIFFFSFSVFFSVQIHRRKRKRKKNSDIKECRSGHNFGQSNLRKKFLVLFLRSHSQLTTPYYVGYDRSTIYCTSTYCFNPAFQSGSSKKTKNYFYILLWFARAHSMTVFMTTNSITQPRLIASPKQGSKRSVSSESSE